MTTTSKKLIKQVSYRIASIFNERLPAWPTVGERDRIRDLVAAEIVDLILSAVRDGRLGQFREVLEAVEHELTTLHGLVVCDGFKAYHEAQRAGADAGGAWNSFVGETWQIDTGEALGVIKAALRPLSGTGKEGTESARVHHPDTKRET